MYGWRIGEELQKWTLGSDSTHFKPVRHTAKADFIAVVRDQVWTANIDEGSGRKPFRVRWSAINEKAGRLALTKPIFRTFWR